MTPSRVLPVVLSGGSGTRLWPLSRADHPKQFHALAGEETLFQQTIVRAKSLAGEGSRPIVVCNASHASFVATQLEELATSATIVLEPEGRNTAPAAATAAELAIRGAAEDSDPLLFVLPADHVIRDLAAFRRAVSAAVAPAAAGYLTTFGVVPDSPETGYGYIRKGQDCGGWAELAEFVEKPDAATAARYIESGDYLWNSGMFLLPARLYLAELERFAPGMRDAVRVAVDSAVVDSDFIRLGAAFADSPASSIDYAVMEKTSRAAVVPLDAGWSDVGSWTALYEIVDRDAEGNVLSGSAIVENCRDSLVRATSRTVGVVGLDGVVVVETDEAVLVMSKECSQQLKALVDKLRS